MIIRVFLEARNERGKEMTTDMMRATKAISTVSNIEVAYF